MKIKWIGLILVLFLTGCTHKIIIMVKTPEVPDWGKQNNPPETPTPIDRGNSTREEKIERPWTANRVFAGPANVLKVWLYIYRGKIYDHRLSPIKYPPGRIREISAQKMSSGWVVTFASEYDPSIRWKMLLPTDDGEYTCQAYLEK